MTPIHTSNRTIGLLGGSFNPAHGGHLHITQHALNALGIDEVWWLVSPQNPLKLKGDMAAYDTRLQSARKVAEGQRRIRVLDIEAKMHTRYSWQTVRGLKRRFPGAHFVWLMGADNLAQFHRWRRWQQLLADIPVIVFDRAPYSHTALRSKTYQRMRRFLLKSTDIARTHAAPALGFVHLRRDPLSSSVLRKTLGSRAFLRHNENAGCS